MTLDEIKLAFDRNDIVTVTPNVQDIRVNWFSGPNFTYKQWKKQDFTIYKRGRKKYERKFRGPFLDASRCAGRPYRICRVEVMHHNRHCVRLCGVNNRINVSAATAQAGPSSFWKQLNKNSPYVIDPAGKRVAVHEMMIPIEAVVQFLQGVNGKMKTMVWIGDKKYKRMLSKNSVLRHGYHETTCKIDGKVHRVRYVQPFWQSIGLEKNMQ